MNTGSALKTAAQGAADQISAGQTDILPIALTVAGSILAAVIGWRLFKRFVKA